MSLTRLALPLLITFLSGLSTILGGIFFLFFKKLNRKMLGFFLGLSAGVMIYLSFVELLPAAIKVNGFFWSNFVFFAGIFTAGILDFIVPHYYLNEKMSKLQIIDKKLLTTGLMVTLGIIIHNLPEGVAVFMSSFTNIKYGLLLAFAITIHNIPEGIAVVAPIYYATRNRLKSLKYAFMAGIAEPVGGIIFYLLFHNYLDRVFVSYLFAFVAGIMVFISFDELLPSCFENGQGHTAISGIVIGMFVISLTLVFL